MKPSCEWPSLGVTQRHPLTAELLNWYGSNARPLPWRSAPEPYATWLSEVILQQTRVDQGTAYWERFMAAFPTVHDLASAPPDEVMALWKGLGYYSRARNLHNAAKHVVTEFGGLLPSTSEEWRSLPGVGAYTAAAISSICHGEAVPVVDGNVQRVMSRLYDITDPVDRKAGREAVDAACAAHVDPDAPGDSNQAWMELGAMVCTPRAPKCGSCPISHGCLSRERGTILDRPVKMPKKKAVEMEVLFSIPLRRQQDGQMQWWVERRPETGIWAQLESFPCTMSIQPPELDSGLFAPDPENRPPRFGPVKHVLTHRRMTAWFSLTDPTLAGPKRQETDGRWVDMEHGAANWPRLIDKVLPELRAWIVKI